MFGELVDGKLSRERVTLHVCSSTKKLTCRSYDVDDAKGAARPAEWKYKVCPALIISSIFYIVSQGTSCLFWPWLLRVFMSNLPW